MSDTKTITEELARLVVQANAPLDAVAIAGEMITLDARLNSYKHGASRRTTLEEWSEVAEAYEVLLGRTQSAAADFARTRDADALIRGLDDIKKSLAAL